MAGGRQASANGLSGDCAGAGLLLAPAASSNVAGWLRKISA